MKITEEMIKNAKSYIPILEKKEISKEIAVHSIIKLTKGNDVLTPDLVSEDTAMKEMLLLQIFLRYYLGIKLDTKANANDIYDEYMQDNVYNQLQRFKSNTEIRDKCYDILDDFKVLRKMVSTDINNLKSVVNDSLDRFLKSFSEGSDPETIKNALKELKDLEKENKDD